jgi:hypothetical protein
LLGHCPHTFRARSGGKLTISVPTGHERRKPGDQDRAMRFIAAFGGVIGTLVLLAPFH